ncbi:MAG: efflux transporter periplasmic adaptor subunit, partial [Pseudomonadales bacterium]|nr:efflux transporter periplasmic adaptor subunit [Pseudomonadales bacterium]
MRNAIKGILTFGVLFMAVIVAYGLVVTAPVPEQVPPEETATTIRVMDVEKERIRLEVRSQGSVTPEVESELIPEVSGRVKWVSPKLATGGFFNKDDVLLRIDDRDYRSAVARNQANVERARA